MTCWHPFRWHSALDGLHPLEFAYDEKAEVYVLRLNPKILSLYKAGWSAIDRDTRQKLRRKPLALWLHGYLSSDAENYPTKVETVHR